VATVNGQEFKGYDIIEHRDLETRYHDRRRVRGLDVKIAPGLRSPSGRRPVPRASQLGVTCRR
jgi:hypothetical protein